MTETIAAAQQTSRVTDPVPENLPRIFAAEEAIARMPDADVIETQTRLGREPADAFLYLWLGLAARERGQLQAAIDAFQHAIERGCAHWRVGWYLAQAARGAGQVALVDQACAAVLNANPKFWFARELPKHARGYYSQVEQDKVIEQFFAQHPPRTKTFVEVGGFDGVHYSNVRRLHEKHGWSGISFEPVAKNFRKLAASYAGTSVKCVQAAISTTDAELEINVSTYPHLPDWGSDVATLGAADTARWEREFGAQWTKEKVPVRRLSRLLDEAGITDFDLISIDTEGHDLEVLKSIDFTRFRPQLIVIEYGENKAAIAEILRRQGYATVQDNGMDLIAARPRPATVTKPSRPLAPNLSTCVATLEAFFAHQAPRAKVALDLGVGPSPAAHFRDHHGWTVLPAPANEAAIDLLSIADSARSAAILSDATWARRPPSVVVAAYGRSRASVLASFARAGYSILGDDGARLIGAQFRAIDAGRLELPPTRNFTGSTGRPAYNEIEDEFQAKLDTWLRRDANTIGCIVIAGGCLGLEVRQFLDRYPRAEIHVFEPSARNFPRLAATYARESRVHCHRLAVSDRAGTATFHEGSLLGVGSLLPPCDKRDANAWVPFEAQEKFEVELTTLDGFGPLHDKAIDLLWCDVQGAELQVLRGGRETLRRCAAIFLEVANTKITYQGQCRFPELDRWCHERGFYLAAIGLCPSGNGTGNAAWLRHPIAAAPATSSVPAATEPAAATPTGELTVVAASALPGQLAKLQPHLLAINYLPVDRDVRIGHLDPLALLTPQRFDLPAKYLYALHREFGVDSPWARELYHEHIRAFSEGTCREGDGSKHNIEDYFAAFDRLLDDVKANGFDATRTLVPIAAGHVLIDGAHRAAACLLHRRPVGVLAFERTDERFGAEFFRQRGLSEASADAIALTYCALRRDVFIATVFPSAVGKDDELRAIFRRHGQLVYTKQVALNRRGARNLIREIYTGESWLGDWRNGFAGVSGKMEPCFRGDGPVRVFGFQTEGLEEVKSLKAEIRALFGLENHSVHINDTQAQALHLARLLLNANSIHFLNHAEPRYLERFVTHLERYRQWLASSGHDPEHFCIDGSAVLSAYGLRDAQDIDVLHFGPADFEPVMPEVNSHNADAHHHTTTRDDIIFNPANHFYAFGVKFASLAAIRRLKVKRNEEKDRRDVALIDGCTGATPDAAPRHYEFTTDWFKTHEPHWHRLLKPWAAGRPALQILEVGSFEGRSSCWMLDHLMSDPRARLTCVDPWPARSSVRVFTEDMEGAYARFRRNIAASGKASQVEVRREHSHTALRTLRAGSFDLIYLDGDHGADAVAEDTRLAFSLLRPGGLLLWDDYYWSEEVRAGVDRACAELGIAVQRLGENAAFEKPRVDPAVPVPPKIVALIPARNEAARLPFCLRALQPYVDAIVYLDDCSDDDSVRVVESLATECRVEHIIRKATWHRDEPGDRNALLRAGRAIGGTHFIVLDADEAFTANCARDDYLRRLVLSLQPGDALTLSWIQLWRSLAQYRFDASNWTYASKAFAFCDDGHASYQSGFIHTLRVPHGLAGRQVPVVNYVHGVMHFQFVDWPNLQIKQAWYRCMERVRQPGRSAAEINAQYAPSEDESELAMRAVPPDWFAGYAALDASVFAARDERRVREVLGWFRAHGLAAFAGLDIWRVDWAALAEPELATEIRRHAGRVAGPPPSLPPAARAQMKIASDHVSRGDLAGCEAALKAALEAAPRHPELLSALGNVCLIRGNAADAHRHLEDSLSADPQQPRVWAQLASACKKMKRQPDFMRALQQALALDSSCVEALRLMAEFHAERGRWRDAAGAWRRVAQLAPQDRKARLQLGRALVAAGDSDDAERVYREILETEPAQPEARAALARLARNGAQSASRRAAAAVGVE